MNAGSKDGINGMIDALLAGHLSVQRMEIVGRNLWRRGLALQAQVYRVAAEMLAASAARKLSLKRAAGRRVSASLVRRSKLKKYLAGREERDERERADQGTRFPL